MNTNYSIPISFNDLMSGKKLTKVSPTESVHQHIHLILMTALGYNRFNPNYGCKIWEKDFDISTTNNNWAQELEKSLYLAITTNESRVYSELKVEVKVTEVEESIEDKSSLSITKYFVAKIENIRLKTTNELIDNFRCTIAFSPVVLE